MRSFPSDAEGCRKRGLSLQSLGSYGEALEAFEAAIAIDPDSAEAHNCRGIALAGLGRYQDAFAGFNRALDINPDYAECYNNRGIVLQELGRLDEAVTSFDKAIALKGDNAQAHNNRGAVLSELRRSNDALTSYERAIALNPSYAAAFYNRGMALHDLKRCDDALTSFDKAIALRPDYAEAHHNRAVVLRDTQRLEEAILAYSAAIRLLPDRAECYTNQGYCFLQLGRFDEGWRLHEWRRRLRPPIGNLSFPQPRWLGREDVSGRTLFMHWEQGFGDTIQFCRYGKFLKARGINVVMSVQDPLNRLLTQLSPEVSIIRQNEVPTAFDYHCPMISLPFATGTTLTTIPTQQRYISSDERLRRMWEARLPATTKPRVGVAWRGSATHKNDRYRSIDLALLSSLFSADAQWISLQYGEQNPKDLPWPPELISYNKMWTDFADTAAVVDGLDLVITVDTSVAHLAGAMGKPTFVLLPFNADWRWLLHRDDSPWYPSVRLFRQHHTELWVDVISRVRRASLEFIRSPHRDAAHTPN